MNATIKQEFPPDWRDAFGNSFGDLLRHAQSEMCMADPRAFRYDPAVFPKEVLREAFRRLRAAWGRTPAVPVEANPEDLMEVELQYLEEFHDDQNRAQSRKIIQAIEARYPGTLARIEAANPGKLAKCELLTKGAAA